MKRHFCRALAAQDVTVLFCDLTGSTALGERLDPEALRALMARYFERMKAIVERHGGTVEKFIGDAVMAVFGVPACTRTTRCAPCGRRRRCATRRAASSASQGADRRQHRRGRDRHRGALVTGDAVNVAARLEQAAQPGEILIGEETHGSSATPSTSSRRAARAKGKSEPVAAYRLRARYARGALRPPPDAPFVGRERELRLLASAFERAVSEALLPPVHAPRAAGIGKSRLAEEFLAARGRACSSGSLPSLRRGDHVLAGGRDRQAAPRDSAVGRGRGRGARGRARDGGDGTSSRGDRLGVPEALRGVAREQPLVVVLDDLHWARADLPRPRRAPRRPSREAPILLLCLARPELLDGRPAGAAAS